MAMIHVQEHAIEDWLSTEKRQLQDKIGRELSKGIRC
jgi:hypothetical protein